MPAATATAPTSERHVQVEVLGELARREGGEAAADEPDEAVGRRGDRALDRRDEHDRLGGQRVVDADDDAARR